TSSTPSNAASASSASSSPSSPAARLEPSSAVISASSPPRLGFNKVPVTWLDVSVDQARVLGLALNKISGTWDEPLLARLLAELQDGAEVDLALSGFDEDEVRDLLRSIETRERRERPEAFDLGEALDDARRSPRSKRGELW